MSSKSQLVSNFESAKKLLDGVEYVLLDVDGVILSGSKVLPGVPETLSLLRRLGKKLRVVTNNSTKPVPFLEKHFAKLGIPFAREEIINSGGATANYLLNHAPSKPLERGNVFVLGSPGLVEDMRAVIPSNRFVYGAEIHPDKYKDHPFNALVKTSNLTAVGEALYRRILPPPEQQKNIGDKPPANESIDSLNISCVVVGLDPSLTLTKLALATLCLRHPTRQCDFIATNTDPQFPISVHDGEHGDKHVTVLLPGSGTVVQSLSVATGRKPDVEVGKPYRHMFDVIADREIQKNPGSSLTPDAFAKKCLMIGDRLTTDVMFGKNAGTKTCLVLTGCETVADMEKTGIFPDFYAKSLGHIGELLLSKGAKSKL